MRALCCKWQIVVFQGWNLSLPALCTFFVFKHNAQSTNCTCTLPKPKESAKDEEMVDVGWFLLGIWWIRFVIPEIGYFWVSIRNWIYAKKLHQKIKKSHVQRINIYCLFRNDFGYTRKKKQFRVIIPESVTNLGGGEEPKNVPSNFGVLQFYIILALALLTILSENFGFSVRRRLSWEMLPK